MDETNKRALREFVAETLRNHGDRHAVYDDESLFVSGRLDSFSMMNLVMYLEQTFGVDFSEVEFDVSLLDSLNAIEKLIDGQPARGTVAVQGRP
jgi:acyl carrier protein